VRKEVIPKDGGNREEMAVGQWAVAQHTMSQHWHDAWTYGIHVIQKHCPRMLTSWYTNCYSYYFPLYIFKIKIFIIEKSVPENEWLKDSVWWIWSLDCFYPNSPLLMLNMHLLFIYMLITSTKLYQWSKYVM